MTSPNPSRSTAPVEYKGEPLDAARGPGLGCFWAQIVLLVVLAIATPLSVGIVPLPFTVVMFVALMLLLLLSGQTMIFLLRLVAASRTEGRRRPLASTTPTVGEIEDSPLPDGAPTPASAADSPADAAPSEPDGRSDAPGMRQ